MSLGTRNAHPLRHVYGSMLTRCTNPNTNEWPRYGGRGIKVCDRWIGPDGFWNFVEDVGPRPPGTSLDRWPDKDGDYESGNVRWATAKDQADNREQTVWLEYDGQTKTTADWARDPICVVNLSNLHARLKRGWSIQDAITIPPTKAKGSKAANAKLTDDEVHTIRKIWDSQPTMADLSSEYGISVSAIQRLVLRETYKDVTVTGVHFNSKLSADDVLRIRSIWDSRTSKEDLAATYGVARSVIQRVIEGKTYKDVP